MDYPDVEQKHHTALERPNYTQTPNILFEELMRDMGEAELKVTLCIIRKIIGYHKYRPEAVSLSQIQKMTGLSRPACIEGLERAIKRGIIKRAGNGKRGVSLFQIVFEDSTSKDGLPVEETTGKNSLLVTSKDGLPTKEKRVKKKESPLTPKGDDKLEALIVLVKKEFKQTTTIATKIAKLMMGLCVGKDTELNLPTPMSLEDFNAFLVDWDKKKDREGNKLARPSNLGSFRRNVLLWQELRVSKVVSPKPEKRWDITQVPDMLSEAEHQAQDAAREGEQS